MPKTGCHVGDKIGFRSGVIGDSVVLIGREPSTVLALVVGQPIKALQGRLMMASDGQSHDRFHMIPGIGDAAREPRECAAG